MLEYGIPGHFKQVLETDALTSANDPIPGIEKQLVKRSAAEIQIRYEYAGKLLPETLILPTFMHEHCTNYLFYCHCPETQSQIHKDNYTCFLKHAWPEARDDPNFFVCVMHNVSSNYGYKWLSENTILIRRPNLGLDFGAFTDALHFTSLDKQVDEKQFFVFFMNDTVFGPTFPWYLQPRPKWTDIFRNMLNEQVKLAGMTINIYSGTPHVQSMVMVADNIGLKLGLKATVFARRSNKDTIISVSEVGFSTAILKANFNIDCLAELLHGIDYRKKIVAPFEFDDVTYDNRYGGFSIHPFETIFSKTNRMHYALSKRLMQKKERTDEEKKTV